MSLESAQQLHNAVTTELGNTSASLDPQTILMEGAKRLAAGTTLGLSTEETLAAVTRQARRERRGLIGPQRDTEQETVADLIRQSRQAQNALGNTGDVIDGNMIRRSNVDSGGSESFEPILGGPASDFSREELEDAAPGSRAFVNPETKESRDEIGSSMDKIKQERRERYKQSREAQGLKPRKNQPTEMSQVYGADDQLEYGYDEPKIYGSTPAEMVTSQLNQRRSVEELGRQESVRLQSGQARRNFNNLATQAAVANQQFPGTEEYDSVSLKRSFESGAPFAQNYGITGGGDIAQVNTPAIYGVAELDEGTYVDPRTGAPIPASEPVLDLASSNSPTSAQMLNAPRTRSASSYVAKQINTGTQYSQERPYPQVDIGTALGSLDDAVAKLGQRKSFMGLEQVAPQQITSLSSLQKASDAILRIGLASGEKFPSTEGGQTTFYTQSDDPATSPGVAEALQKAGLGEADRERISLALQAGGGQGKPYPVTPTGSFNISERSADTEVPSKRIYTGSVPMGYDYGASNIRRVESEGKQSFAGKLREAVRGGSVKDSEAASPFIGASADRPVPQTTVTRRSDTAEDIPTIKRLDYLSTALDMPVKAEGDKPGLVRRGAIALQKQGVEKPTMGAVMDFLDTQYNVRRDKGTLSKVTRGARKGQQKEIDQSSLDATIKRNLEGRRRADAFEEEQAISRLLEGPLEPGPYPKSNMSVSEIRGLRPRRGM